MDNGNKKNIFKYWIILPIIIFLFIRLLPFIINQEHPLGYDTGFYYYSLEKQRDNIDNNGFLSNIKGINKDLEVTESIGSRFITNILIISNFSNQAILYWLYILIGLMSGFLIYLITKKHFGQYPALLSFCLYSLSTVQYTAFTNMLWKNNIGVFLILLSIYLIEILQQRKKYYLLASYSIIISLILMITNKTSAFIFIIILIGYILINQTKKNYKIYFSLILIILISILAYLNLDQLTDFYQNHDRFNIKNGEFITWWTYITYTILYLPFGIYTAYKLWSTKKYNLILILFSLTLFLTIIHFLFYQRLFIFLDLAIIILACPAIINLGKYFKIKNKTWLIGCLIFYIAIFSYPLLKYEPMIEHDKLMDIKKLNDLPSYFRVFTDQTKNISWLYGFSGHPVIGPGWPDPKRPDNNWSYERWKSYWNNDITVKEQYLNELNKTIIINTKELKNLNPDCLDKINNHFSFFKCP